MNFDDLENYMAKEDTNFSIDAYRLNFTANHDENTWNGTVFERYGDNYKNWAVAMATIDGMPLLYSGQEAMMRNRLEFFRKDTIDWQDYPLHDFYKELCGLKETHQALWNGKFGGSFTRIINNKSKSVLSFARQKEDDIVMVIINFSDKTENVILEKVPQESFIDFFSTIDGTYNGKDTLSIEPNDFKVFVLE
jgi:glycosidase